MFNMAVCLAVMLLVVHVVHSYDAHLKPLDFDVTKRSRIHRQQPKACCSIRNNKVVVKKGYYAIRSGRRIIVRQRGTSRMAGTFECSAGQARRDQAENARLFLTVQP